MLIWSIFILVLIVLALLRNLDAKKALFISLIGIFSYYLAGYEIRFDLIISQLHVVEILQIAAAVISTLLLFYIFKIMDKTKILNDWHSLAVIIFPYTVQKMVFLFYICQIIFVNYNFLFFTLVLYMIIARTLKISRLHSAIILIMTATYKILLTNISYISQSDSTDFSLVNQLFNDQTLFLVIINIVSILMICVLDKFSYRTTKDLERINLHIKNYVILFIIVISTFTLSIVIFEIYFDLYTSEILASTMTVIALAIVSKLGFNKLDFLDFDDFFQRKVDNVAIIISFIILVVLFSSYFIGILVNMYLAIALLIVTLLFILRVYKPQRDEIDFNYSDIYLIIIVTLAFAANNLFIDNSVFNNSDYETSITQTLFDVLSSSNNKFLDALNFLTRFPFLQSENVHQLISADNKDAVELFATQIFSIGTTFSMFVIAFLLKLMRVKEQDYGEMFTSLVLYFGIYIVATFIIFLIN